MRGRLLCLGLAFAAAVTWVRAEDKPAVTTDPVAKGKEVVEAKKCALCHGADNSKKPMKVEGKSAEWISKYLAGEENGPNGKPHMFKGKLTDDEKQAVIAYVQSLK